MPKVSPRTQYIRNAVPDPDSAEAVYVVSIANPQKADHKPGHVFAVTAEHAAGTVYDHTHRHCTPEEITKYLSNEAVERQRIGKVEREKKNDMNINVTVPASAPAVSAVHEAIAANHPIVDDIKKVTKGK